MMYLWVKAFHLISMVCWFAAIFYLPRLFVYHAQSTDEISKQRFCVMERKLFYGIMTPSAIATGVFGIWLLSYIGIPGVWFHVKMLFVTLVVAFHTWCGFVVNAFAQDKNTKSHTFYRIMNELPVLALFAIIILAVVKPW